MKNIKLLFACTLLLSLAACGDDDDTTPADSPPADTTGNDTSPPPNMPALGPQIERMGRPAINTALTHPFDPDMDSKFAAKDAYNADGDPQNWGTYAAEFAGNLAVFDGLDNPVGANGCGNQILACGTGACAGPPTPADVPPRYATFAGAASDDELYLDSAIGDCTDDFYLAVEAAAVLGVATGKCGGRTLDLDVIDRTYTFVATGLAPVVGDGIAGNDAVTDNDTFPFLAAPH